VTLVLGVDVVDRAAHERRVAAVENLILLWILYTQFLELFVDLFPTDEHGSAVPGLPECDRRTKHIGLFSFGEKYSLGILSSVFVCEAHYSYRGIQPAAQLLSVSLHVGDRLLG